MTERGGQRSGQGRSGDGVVRIAALDRSLTLAVGKPTARKLERLGLYTVRDLLEYYPRTVIDPGTLTNLGEVEVGQHVVLTVDIASFSSRPRRSGQGHVVEVELTDGRDRLLMVQFPRHAGTLAFLKRELSVGRRLVVDGTVELRQGRKQVVHPSYTAVDSASSEEAATAERLVPQVRYGQTKGLESGAIHALIKAQLDLFDDAELPDPVPLEVRMAQGLRPHAMALRDIHLPREVADFYRAREALRFEEAFVLQAAMVRRRLDLAAEPATARPLRPGGILDAFDATLPFVLTHGQHEVGAQIAHELAQSAPMHRLLQGEVGSGKTLVALRAMLQVVAAGGQAALLAPTEVLAAQHERSIRAMLGPLGEGGMLGGSPDATRVVLLTGSMSAAQRRKALAEAAGGSAGIVIGTHALLQEHVAFADLGLVVVDEQHRFGVEQRDALRGKAKVIPHLLVMTATPIPRTVAMTIFGDLEVSTLREVPAGRAEVVTHVVSEHRAGWWARMWARAAEEVANGSRVYVVCPRITDTTGEAEEVLMDDGAADLGGDPSAREGEPRAVHSIESTRQLLATLPQFAGVGVAVLHGKMSPEEKESAMADFTSGRRPVLLATTVIEVGVDVPEAGVMVVLDADRFGLSQLHQLRGRIGRGSVPGVCFAVTAVEPTVPPRDANGNQPPPVKPPALERLETFASTRDGFALAEADLKQRKEGDVLGAAQHGRSRSLRLLRVVTDRRTIERARDAARPVVEQDAALTQNPELAEAIARTLAGEREEYLERS